MRTSNGRTRTALVLALVSATVLGCDAPKNDVECDPAPSFAGNPSTSAVVGQTWWYDPHAIWVCGIAVCRNFEAVQMPAGAAISLPYIFWNPTAEQAGMTHTFVIQTPTDGCGHRATQTWDVFVVSAG
jgi:hypothetical protein